jgi:16S rRNA A1518/A1519 N6-dimethyltransferase RsmA/KsgA/DIM1 with predicted DNA glycosylase/AP lyase activity
MWEDFWQGFSTFFKADPRRDGDPEVERLAQEINGASTVLDVGGGAGRFALPLALRCRQATVVEPSQSMVDGLRALASASKIKNVTVIQQRWEDAVAFPGTSCFALTACTPSLRLNRSFGS